MLLLPNNKHGISEILLYLSGSALGKGEIVFFLEEKERNPDQILQA